MNVGSYADANTLRHWRTLQCPSPSASLRWIFPCLILRSKRLSRQLISAQWHHHRSEATTTDTRARREDAGCLLPVQQAPSLAVRLTAQPWENRGGVTHEGGSRRVLSAWASFSGAQRRLLARVKGQRCSKIAVAHLPPRLLLYLQSPFLVRLIPVLDSNRHGRWCCNCRRSTFVACVPQNRSP